ncbi:MAG: polysaccharide biosynthesis protein [Burkholderiales bacterium]|nr:polysaccharide biosynthesis protein [Burkholderiales bacterium]
MTRPAAPPTGWHRLDRWLARLRPHREPLSLAVDALMVVLAWNATYLFRLGFERWWTARPGYDGWVLAGVVAVYLAAFAAAKVPQSMWRFSGFGEVKRLTLACLAAGGVSALGVLGLQLVQVPRAVLALHPLVALMAVCGVRIGYRMLYEHARARITGSQAEVRRALVLGAGEAARRLLAGIHQQGWVVLGLLDDDPAKQGARIAGVPVLGPLAAVRDKGVRGAATHLIIAMPAASAAQRRQAVELAGATGLPVLTVPSAEELRQGSGVERVRDIEPEDLLGREPVVLDEAGIAQCLAGRTVLVTGAGGSIGSELCRQVARFSPARLVLYELSEYALYSIEQDLQAAFPRLELVRLIGDVKDLDHLRASFARWRPQVVFHAAAFKHVPLMEEPHNAGAALRNNTLGTYHAALVAAEQGAERFVLISTDKAVNPTNVMGATKRAAELVVSALAAEHPGTRFMAVRFGNVLGSSGSVIPKFKAQIAAGGPVTVTHPDIIRYFMTIPEAARLVLQAAAIGETGQVLVLDMGEPVRIVDLARTMIRLAGRTEQDIPIVFSGLRPGEKLYEELLADDDATVPTAVPRLRVARLAACGSTGGIRRWMEAAGVAAASVEDDQRVRSLLQQWVPEFRRPK